MKILILNGSPNRDRGATGAVLASFEEGLLNKDPEITTKHVYSLNIKPCLGCFSCWTKTPGECIQKDDMREILGLMADADLLILATPVYVDGMTGPMKVMMDRIIPLIKGSVELRDDHMRHVPRSIGEKKLALVSASGFAELNNFDPLVTHVKAIAKNMNSEYVGEVLVPSAWFLPYVKPVYNRVTDMITEAGKELMEKGSIPAEVSAQIASMIPRKDIVEAMNSYYGTFE